MTITMSGKEYNALMKYLKPGLSKDPTKPTLSLIHVFNDGDQIIFETCNGYMIKRQVFTVTDDDLLNFDITVEVPPLKMLSKDVVTINFLINAFVINVDDTPYFIKSTGVEYVNTDDHFYKPDQDVVEYGFTVEYLKAVLDGYTGQIKLTFRTDKNIYPVYIEHLDDPGKASLLVPVRLR